LGEEGVEIDRVFSHVKERSEERQRADMKKVEIGVPESYLPTPSIFGNR
jgi:hypothetical protein